MTVLNLMLAQYNTKTMVTSRRLAVYQGSLLSYQPASRSASEYTIVNREPVEYGLFPQSLVTVYTSSDLGKRHTTYVRVTLSEWSCQCNRTKIISLSTKQNILKRKSDIILNIAEGRDHHECLVSDSRYRIHYIYSDIKVLISR